MENNKKFILSMGLLFLIIAIIGISFMLGNNYLKEKNQLARDKFVQEKADADRKFDADQKESCLAIYKQEISKWNNVNGWRYDNIKDLCYVQYKESPKKTNTQCDAEYKGTDGIVQPLFFTDWLNCYEGIFEKSF